MIAQVVHSSHANLCDGPNNGLTRAPAFRSATSFKRRSWLPAYPLSVNSGHFPVARFIHLG
ncbi:hypothetical protein K9B32_02225 [Rhizobium sp. 3T7]|nr:hypothetical protein [Rhizobium sp. 3T7]